MATLVIVESPGKIKKIQQILGSGYTVKASLGHVRDLPRRELGIDVEAGFTPRYEPLPDKKQVIQSLKRAAAGAEMVYLATDPDREGEAIAWHIQKLLPRGTRSQRISFNEITPDAVLEAVHTPRAIDQALVEAQNARRVIDRLVGYKVSPLLQEAMQDRNLSAGRVQTSALRLLVERERERANFQPRHYWTLYVQLAHTRLPFYARLVKPMTIPSPGERDFFVTQFARASRWWVDHVEATTDTTRPPAPFTTSTLQQEAAKVYQFTPDETLAAAQKLYEAGFISYIRTDATHIAPEAQRQARATIAKLFGDSYIPPEPPHYRSRPGAQEAHEAIRPTDVALHPATLGQSPDSAELSPAGHQLYDLIWQRFTASQMAPATYAVSQAHVRCGEQANPLPYPFAARARELSFPGFKRVYQEAPDVDETPGDDEEHSTPAAEGRRPA